MSLNKRFQDVERASPACGWYKDLIMMRWRPEQTKMIGWDPEHCPQKAGKNIEEKIYDIKKYFIEWKIWQWKNKLVWREEKKGRKEKKKKEKKKKGGKKKKEEKKINVTKKCMKG